MPGDVKGILLRGEHLKGLQMLSDSQRGKLVLALFADAGECDFPEIDDMTKIVFELIAPSVRRANDAYQKRRDANIENGKKGGRPRKSTTYETKETEQETQKPVGFSVKTQETEQETQNPNEAKRSEANINEEEIGEEAAKPAAPACPPCPHKQIVELYHEVLPTLPRVKVWNKEREGNLQARWRERWASGKYATQESGLDYWRRLFGHIRNNCPWLMGEISGRDNKAFLADLGWIILPRNFTKIIEGKYDRREA